LALKSRVSERFCRLLERLPGEIQRLAEKNYHLWRASPSHPSLQFRQLELQWCGSDLTLSYDRIVGENDRLQRKSARRTVKLARTALMICLI
jgi:hypothetical protein